jgi:hypothetical protein
MKKHRTKVANGAERAQRSNARSEWSRNGSEEKLQAALHANDEIDRVKAATALFHSRRTKIISPVDAREGRDARSRGE